jgi:hypothetical protein
MSRSASASTIAIVSSDAPPPSPTAGEEMPVATYTGLGYWTPQGYWRFPIGNAERPGGWVETLRAQATDGDLAVAQWKAFRNRLKDLCGTMSAVSLLNLRQVQAP